MDDRTTDLFLYASDDEINDMVDMCMEATQGAIRSGTDSLAPIISIMLVTPKMEKKSVLVAIPSFPEDVSKKREMIEAIGAKISHDMGIPVVVAMVVEAWRSLRTDIMPREDPERQEIVAFIATSIDGRTAAKFFDIKRTPENNIELGQLTCDVHAGDSDPTMKFDNNLAMSLFKGSVEYYEKGRGQQNGRQN